MQVKICGMTNGTDALAAAQCGADFVGLILAASPRRVTIEMAPSVLAVLPPATQPVLVFRDAPLDEVLAAMDVLGCRWVQLHGREPVEYVAEIAQRRPAIRVIKAWEVTSAESGEDLADYLSRLVAGRGRLAVVLLDAPKGGPHPGFATLAGVASRCRAELSTERLHGGRAVQPEIWCAGALTPGNVATVVASGLYTGVDVSSGVELTPGRKDHAAVRKFIETVRRCSNQAGPPTGR